jgi:hypothetical protein
MEVAGIIGTAGAIVGIIDIAARSILVLADIRRRFKETNLTLELLSNQLLSVRTALEQIHALINDSLEEDDPHYSMMISLDSSVKCCGFLVRLLDENIAKFEYDDDESLTLESRVRLVLDSKGIEECQARLDRQINALTLVLTAYKW